MKKKSNSLACLLFLAATCLGQSEDGLLGTWEGKLHVGVVLRIVLHFNRDSTGKIAASMDSPDQGANGIPCGEVRLIGDSLHLAIPAVAGHYDGRLMEDSSIDGRWKQSVSLVLNLKKVNKVSELVRPQTPKPPYSYQSIDLEYDNADKSIHYGATLTIPTGEGPFPAVVLITGSGPQNRDEEILGHKPFAVIADYLTRRGVEVLRVDDRAVGKSTGDFLHATSADFAKDVNTSLDFLKRRPEVDTKRMGLIGHSEGGMIAPMVAAGRTDVDFIILLAGPGVKGSELLAKQNADILLSEGVNSKAVDSFLPVFLAMESDIMESTDSTTLNKRLTQTLDEFRKNAPGPYVLATTNVFNDSTEKVYVKEISTQMNSVWFRYFLAFEPSRYLEKLHCRVLALNGSRDLQVAPDPNLEAIGKALRKSHSAHYDLVKMPGLNHLFQTCNKCQVEEYGELEETFSPLALKAMGDWIDRQVK